MKTTAKITAMLLVFGLWGGIASATVITLDFEDLTLGQSYNVGDSFTTSDVLITVEEFQRSNGTWRTDGDVTVDTDSGLGFNTAGGSGNELGVSGVNLYFDFDTTLIGLELLYGDFGGNLNIELNGDFVNFGNFIDIDNTTIGGTSISTLDNGTPGQSTGTLSVVGTIQSFRIGGAELWIDNVVVIPYQPKTYYVDVTEGSDNNDGLSKETAFATIQKAIDSAFDGDTVIVADGTYTGPGNRDIDFLGKAITVRSESGPENCIIDCNGTEDEPHRGFYFNNGEDANSVLEGFTVKNGCLRDDVGGAIFCQRSSPTIANCILKSNSAIAGGGIYCNRSNATITNCVITSNRCNGIGGGIALFLGRNPKVVNCIISYNSGSAGGGIYCDDCNGVISNCIIQGNSGTEGGGVNAYAWPLRNITLSNCLVTDNSGSQNGGGLKVSTSTPITNCTIVGNSAPIGGGLYKCDATLNNCIIWDNFPQQVVDIYDTTSVIYSNVDGGWPGVGNINADPCFVELGYWDANDTPDDVNDDFWVDGDYYLLPYSLCIDAGDPDYLPEPDETDIDGNPRVIGDAIDMGAYETNYIQAAMKLTPQMLNCNSKGKYVKAHLTLPEGFLPEDVDVNESAIAEPMGVQSEYIKVLGNDDGLVRLEIAFDRETFCAQITETGEVEVIVIGSLTTSRYFYATDTIKIKPRR